MEDGSWGWNVFFFSIFFSFFPPLFQVYLKCASASVFCLFVNVTVNLFKKKKKKRWKSWGDYNCQQLVRMLKLHVV